MNNLIIIQLFTFGPIFHYLRFLKQSWAPACQWRECEHWILPFLCLSFLSFLLPCMPGFLHDFFPASLLSFIPHVLHHSPVQHPSCIPPVLHSSVLRHSFIQFFLTCIPLLHPTYPSYILSFPASRFYCIPPVLHTSCPASLMSCIPPVLHTSFPASLMSCIPPVLHLSCPASLLSCIPRVLHPSCIPPVLHATFPASLLNCIPRIMQQSCK